MSTVLESETRVRLTVEEFERILDTGIFEDRHVELLGGELFEVTKNPPHDFAITGLANRLRDILPRTDWMIREEKAIQLLPYWRPEPDISVARGPVTQFKWRHPAPADLPLLIEVSETTQEVDRGRKLRGYAAVGIPAYWIVDLARRTVDVHTQPTGAGDDATYGSVATLDESQAIAVILDGRDYGRIAVRDILP